MAWAERCNVLATVSELFGIRAIGIETPDGGFTRAAAAGQFDENVAPITAGNGSSSPGSGVTQNRRLAGAIG